MSLPCVILAGGLGTRIASYWSGGPKAMVPIRGVPFAHWQLSWLSDAGIRDVVYCVGYQSTMIRDFVRDGSRWGMNVTYVDEGDNLLGTGGALRLVYDQGKLSDEFYVLNGDSFLSCDFDSVEREWRRSGCPALMTVFRNEGRWDTSNVIYEAGKVLCYDKSRPDDLRPQMLWIDYGLEILTSEVVSTTIHAGVRTDLADVMRDLSTRGELAGFEVTQRFFEVGTEAGVQALEEHLQSALP